MKQARRVKNVDVQAPSEMACIAERVFFVLALSLAGIALYQLLKLLMHGYW